jgi:hypothetical protein
VKKETNANHSIGQPDQQKQQGDQAKGLHQLHSMTIILFSTLQRNIRQGIKETLKRVFATFETKSQSFVQFYSAPGS